MFGARDRRHHRIIADTFFCLPRLCLPQFAAGFFSSCSRAALRLQYNPRGTSISLLKYRLRA